jgi:hypothetical protein
MSQGASNGGGQGAGKSFVSFSRPAAQRIAKAVRTVEAGDRNQSGLTFDHPMPGGATKLIRRATFSGAWAVNSTAVVTFVQAPTATASATNLTWPLGGCTQSTTTCIVGKEGTSWWLITPSLPSLQGYNGTNIQLLGHAASGCMRWYDISTCSTSTSA